MYKCDLVVINPLEIRHSKLFASNKTYVHKKKFAVQMQIILGIT